jgi:hypothetical protein
MQPDLAVSLDAFPRPFGAREHMQYKLTVRNIGQLAYHD